MVVTSHFITRIFSHIKCSFTCLILEATKGVHSHQRCKGGGDFCLNLNVQTCPWVNETYLKKYIHNETEYGKMLSIL